MHSLGLLAGLLVLIGLAFGKRAASVIAAVILIGLPLLVVGLFVLRWLISNGIVEPV